MSSYLQIAEDVLLAAKRPLSARAILRQAYLQGLMPGHLYGRTQHKTLQARLSEDILHRREHSAFFRTKPGQFFLRKFIDDASLPAEYRRPITARRRTRDLLRGPALSFIYDSAFRKWKKDHFESVHFLKSASENGGYHYIDPKNPSEEDVLLWSVAAVMRDGKMLSYRVGRYRDDRDSFRHKRSVAFSTLVTDADCTLFDMENLGISDAAFHAAALDLDIPLPEAFASQRSFHHQVRFLAWQPGRDAPKGIMAYVEICAPEWFEPVASSLSLNDLDWLDMAVAPNDWDDFDPWSRIILSHYFPGAKVHG